ncbi:Homoserine O-acetyltransferase [hydrothermal vent metagenome]|uniref:Homoserine O-acetyltransferase n=1 Tax=hydrothermal vent metagenome TaxID=652676 RepID=A0A3B1BP97_9ZZZZ
MPESIPADSVGLVSPQTKHFKDPVELVCGKTLPRFDLVYETYGELNANGSNALLICHALSGDHHAAGYHSMEDRKPGWWDNCIGPGKPFDTNHFFVVCPNNLGGCKGSTGPNTINPATGKFYGPDFPIFTVKDWVTSQKQLMDALGISQWAAVIGGSLGGMQVIQWAIDYPGKLRHALVIAAATKLSAQNIGFNEVARQAILSDPEYHGGHYYEHNTVPGRGLMLARMLGHITYLSDDAMRAQFGRDLQTGRLSYDFDVQFQVESYLRHQGTTFVEHFDANTYLLMTKALDYFDPAAEYEGGLAAAFAETQAKFLVVSFTSDWRFAPTRSRAIVKTLTDAKRQVSYAEVESSEGHDAFLLPNTYYMDVLTAYMNGVAVKVAT